MLCLVATGLPIYISELNISLSNDQQQLDAFKRVFPIFWDKPAVKGVTPREYQHGKIWRADSYLIRSDGSERPALTWLREYIATTHVLKVFDKYRPAPIFGSQFKCQSVSPSR